MDLIWIVNLVMEKGSLIMKLRQFGAFCTCIFSLSISSTVNAAFYDFNQWVNDNGEQAFDNNSNNSDGLSRFNFTVDGLRLRARAFTGSNNGKNVYLDDLLDGTGTAAIGGMGVCRQGLDADNLCTGNPILERNQRERLRWDFTEDISSITLGFLNETNGFINQQFQYKYNGDAWTTATTDIDGMVTLAFDGSSSRIQFRAKGNAEARQFYIVSADVAAVPVPAAVWLFASGLLGLVGVSRRRS